MSKFLERLKKKSRMTFEDFATFKRGDKLYAYGVLCYFVQRGTGTLHVNSPHVNQILVCSDRNDAVVWVSPADCRRYVWWKPMFGWLIMLAGYFCGSSK